MALYVEDPKLHGGIGGLVEDRTIGATFGRAADCIRVGRRYNDSIDRVEPFDGDIDNVFVFADTLWLQDLEFIRKGGAAAIIALARGESVPSKEPRVQALPQGNGGDAQRPPTP